MVPELERIVFQMFIESGTVKCWPIWSPAGSIGMKGARWQGKVENNILCFSEEKIFRRYTRVANYRKLDRVTFDGTRYIRSGGYFFFSSLDRNVRVLSLSVYGRFVSFIGSNGLDKWLKLHRKFVRIQFHWRKRNENYIYIYIWNFKNLQFDGIASKVCSGRWCPLAE